MNDSAAASSASSAQHYPWRIAAALLVVVVAGLLGKQWYQTRQDDRLLRSEASSLQGNDALLAYAANRAAPIYQEHCASCHGADLKGNLQHGVPNLTDSVWLYGTGQIADIEQTITYGIRSGHPKAHNLTDMPGLGRIGQLTKADVQDVVEYVLKLSNQAFDAAAAERGLYVFNNHGVCYDCHGADGYGVSDYGSTPLTGRDGSWLYGGDRATLIKSVTDGRHGLCPAWINTLSFAEIRALSAYLYHASHPNKSAPTS